MHVTLKDVCKKTGFSTATVSRVLNGSPLVTEDTKRRVLAVVEDLGYQPSHTARMLKLKRTDMLAVVFPPLDVGFFTEVLRGIDAATSEHNYHMMTAFSHGPEDERKLINRVIRERRADALILMNLTLPENYLRGLARYGMPITLIDRPMARSKMASVSLDNRTGARAATVHLLDHGHRNIAFITGPKGTYDADERLAAFRETMQERNCPVDRQLIWPGRFTEPSGREALARWLDGGGDLPDAIFAANDAMAIGALGVLRERGYDVPRDTALVGFDDIESARYLGITTVHVPMRELGAKSAQVAIQQVTRHQTGIAHRLPTELVVRASCGTHTGNAAPRAQAVSTRSRNIPT